MDSAQVERHTWTEEKRIRQWRCRLPFKGDLTDALCEPLFPNRLLWCDRPFMFWQSFGARFLVVGPSKSGAFYSTDLAFQAPPLARPLVDGLQRLAFFSVDFIHHCNAVLLGDESTKLSLLLQMRREMRRREIIIILSASSCCSRGAIIKVDEFLGLL